MKRWETAGWVLLVLTLIGTPLAIVSYQRSLAHRPHLYTIVAHTMEDGGFTPSEITAVQGEHARLRLTSADVTHGFNCPGLGIYVPEIYPGKYVTVDFTPAKAGRYLFVCTVLCSPSHGNMQGTIVVRPSRRSPGSSRVALRR